VPTGPLDALFAVHVQASEIFGKLLADSGQDWEATYTLTSNLLPSEKRTATRRKVMGHALLHGQRHWAQLATLVRAAGFRRIFAATWSSALLCARCRSCGTLSLLLLKTRTAEHRAALRGLKGHRRLRGALRAGGTGFWAHPCSRSSALRLALFTALWVVHEQLVTKEKLLARGKHKICAAVHTLQYAINVVHGRIPETKGKLRSRPWCGNACRSRFPCLRTSFNNKGPGREWCSGEKEGVSDCSDSASTQSTGGRVDGGSCDGQPSLTQAYFALPALFGRPCWTGLLQSGSIEISPALCELSCDSACVPMLL